jgi:CBS-domain-containing membrane protein
VEIRVARTISTATLQEKTMMGQPSIYMSHRLILCAEAAADLMAPNPVSIAAGASVQEAATFLADRGFSAAPVIDQAGRPVGVLSQSDIVVHDRESSPHLSGNPEYYEKVDLSRPRIVRTDVVDGDPTQVRDIMTPIVFSVSPDTPAYKVIEDMLAHKVHRLFVVGADGVLIGTISTVDVLRHLRPEEPAADRHRAPAPEAVSVPFSYEPW